MTGDELQRIAVLENEMKHLNEKLEDVHVKTSQMYDLLMQAKGARWVIIGAATLSGAITAFVVKLFPFFGTLPK